MDHQNRDRATQRNRENQAWGQILHFMKDESGQGTAEYALILLVVLMMANTFKNQFKTFMKTLTGALNSQIEEATQEE
jgi:Flp pilus assembly pilin Flp